MKNQKGITLVALIITIVVMLILVAVSVAVVVNSNIIGAAEKSGAAYTEADDKLNNVASDKILSGNTKSVEDYMTNAGITVE